MSPTMFKLSLPLAVLALAACGQGGGDAAPVASDTGAPASATSSAPASSANLWRGGEVVPLDVQVAHPSGAVLQLTSIQSRPTETVIAMRVINGRDREISLNRFNSNRNGYVVVDSGERLYLSAPAGNPRLSVPAGQTMEGELVFLGRLPTANSAILILNENGQTDSEHTNTPAFRITLPLSGAGAATAPAAPAPAAS